MKALSIKQPWAWAIIHAGKDIENRTWAPTYEGPLLIHASKKIDKLALRRFLDIGFKITPADLHLGHIIGMVWMHGFIIHSSSKWFTGPYGFKLSYPCVFRPVIYAGRLGLFDVPDRLIDEIKDVRLDKHAYRIWHDARDVPQQKQQQEEL